MRVLHRTRNLGHQRHDPPRIIPKAASDILQAPARCEFHAEERQAVVAFAYFVDRQNVWMIEAGCCLRFAPETGKRFARIRVKAQNALQRNDSARMTLARAINDAHPAATDFFQDLIIANAPVGIANIDFQSLAGILFGRAVPPGRGVRARPLRPHNL